MGLVGAVIGFNVPNGPTRISGPNGYSGGVILAVQLGDYLCLLYFTPLIGPNDSTAMEGGGPPPNVAMAHGSNVFTSLGPLVPLN